MTMLGAIIQGLIQGFTEFLPVSSSGHLSLYQYFTGINSESSVLFSVMLHFGTLLAVFIAFWRTIRELMVEAGKLIADIFTMRVFKVHANPKRRMLFMLVLSCLPLLLVLPAKDMIEGFSSDNSILVEGVCFLGTALLLTLADSVAKGGKTAKSMTVPDAIAVGGAQLLATLPGLSRSGSTISVGLLCGFTRSYAVAYSFILGMPAILAAGLLDIADLLGATGAATELNWLPAIAGMAVAAVSGLLAIKLVNYIVKSDRFKIFAVYTFILGIGVTAIGIMEIFSGNAIQHWIVSMLA